MASATGSDAENATAADVYNIVIAELRAASLVLPAVDASPFLTLVFTVRLWKPEMKKCGMSILMNDGDPPVILVHFVVAVVDVVKVYGQ
jgi:hypothetical protein